MASNNQKQPVITSNESPFKDNKQDKAIRFIF